MLSPPFLIFQILPPPPGEVIKIYFPFIIGFQPWRSLYCGNRKIIDDPLVDMNSIPLLPLHIKLGIMKQSAKAFDNDSDCFKYISAAFPDLSEGKNEKSLMVLK